jgi:hypothetical protein
VCITNAKTTAEGWKYTYPRRSVMWHRIRNAIRNAVSRWATGFTATEVNLLWDSRDYYRAEYLKGHPGARV